MSTASFLQAIADAPEEDAPRLVYADWLEEHGDESDRERAEFIRAQCLLACIPSADPRYVALAAREKELRDGSVAHWKATLPRASGVSWHHDDLERGFVRHCEFRIFATFAEHAEIMLQATPAPIVSFGQLNGCKKLALHPAFRLVRRILLRNSGIRDDDLAALGQSPHRAGLTGLMLCDSRVGPDGARAFISGMPGMRLRTLRLLRNALHDSVAEAIAACPASRLLTTLDLSQTQLTDAGAIALANSPHLANLTTLDLSGNDIRYAGALGLADSPYLQRLTQLALRYTRMQPDALARLAERFGPAFNPEWDGRRPTLRYRSYL